MDVTERSGWAELMGGANLSLLLAISAGIGLHAFNQFAIVTALPVAVAEIGGASIYSWAYSLYFVGSVIGGVSAILFRQQYGARAVLVVACLMFVAGIIAATTAPTFLWIIVGRSLQGIADGLLAAVCYSLIPDGFRSSLLPKVFAVEAGVWAVASFLGPLLGGFTTEHLSWRATFLLPLPLVVLLLALALLSVSGERSQRTIGRIALPMLLCLAGALALSAPSAIEGTVARLVCLVLGAALLFASVRCGMAPTRRLFPVDAFRPGTTIGNGFWMLFLMSYAQALSGVYLALIAIRHWHYSPMVAGIIVVTMPMAWSVVAVVVGSVKSEKVRLWSLRYGALHLVSGFAVLGTGLALGNGALMMVGQTLVGAGFGLAWAGINQEVIETGRRGDTTDGSERDLTSALLPTVATAGSAAGAGASGTIATATALVPALNDGNPLPSLFGLYGLAVIVSLITFLFGLRLSKESRPGCPPIR